MSTEAETRWRALAERCDRERRRAQALWDENPVLLEFMAILCVALAADEAGHEAYHRARGFPDLRCPPDHPLATLGTWGFLPRHAVEECKRIVTHQTDGTLHQLTPEFFGSEHTIKRH